MPGEEEGEIPFICSWFGIRCDMSTAFSSSSVIGRKGKNFQTYFWVDVKAEIMLKRSRLRKIKSSQYFHLNPSGKAIESSARAWNFNSNLPGGKVALAKPLKFIYLLMRCGRKLSALNYCLNSSAQLTGNLINCELRGGLIGVPHFHPGTLTEQSQELRLKFLRQRDVKIYVEKGLHLNFASLMSTSRDDLCEHQHFANISAKQNIYTPHIVPWRCLADGTTRFYSLLWAFVVVLFGGNLLWTEAQHREYTQQKV